MRPGSDPRPRAWTLWQRLVSDDELYRATIAGRYREPPRRDLDEEDLQLLDELHAQPGTRWNIENLRFRAADEVGTKLQIHLPRTMALLTRGLEDWLRDLAFEYLAHYRWHEFGQHRFDECDRFLGYVDECIAKRRRLPDHLGTVIAFERAIYERIRATRGVTWPPRPALDAPGAVERSRPRPGPLVRIVELAEDIGEWIQTGDPLVGTVGPEPIQLLLAITGPEQPYRLQRLGDGARYVFDHCTGERSADEIATTIEAADVGLDRRAVLSLLSRWLDEAILVG